MMKSQGCCRAMSAICVCVSCPMFSMGTVE